MPSQTDYSDAFWLAYADAVKGSWKSSPSTAIFISQQGQLGPAGGPGIDERYTNYGVYQIADNLLNDNTLNYTPGQGVSYSRSLLTFLDWVDLGGEPNETNEAFLSERLKDQSSAQKALDNAKNAAQTNFERDLELGIAEKGTKFNSWATVNAPAYSTALNDFQAASSQVLMAQNRLKGPKSGQYTADRQRLTNALYADNLQNGITMSATGQSAKGAAELRRAQQAGEKLDEPSGTTYLPEYRAQNYGQIIKEFINASGTDPAKAKWDSATITFDKGTKVDKSEFGQTSIGANVSFPTPWFAVSVSGDTSTDTSFVLRSTDQQKTSVTVKWTDRRLVSLTSGKWDFKNSGYELKSDAPPAAKNLIRPTQMICFNNLCYDIKFEGESVNEVDQSITEAKAGRAGLAIFGWNIGFGGQASSKKTATSHTASWDKQNGLLSILPHQYGLSANVGALVGERVTMSN